MNDRIARAALTRLFEPGDRVGRALVGRLGAYAALRFATGAQPVHAIPEATVEELSEALKRWAPRVPELTDDAAPAGATHTQDVLELSLLTMTQGPLCR